MQLITFSSFNLPKKSQPLPHRDTPVLGARVPNGYSHRKGHSTAHSAINAIDTDQNAHACVTSRPFITSLVLRCLIEAGAQQKRMCGGARGAGATVHVHHTTTRDLAVPLLQHTDVHRHTATSQPRLPPWEARWCVWMAANGHRHVGCGCARSWRQWCAKYHGWTSQWRYNGMICRNYAHTDHIVPRYPREISICAPHGVSVVPPLRAAKHQK